ncbi:hypothetical protein SAMN04487960_107217 [Marinobacter mobilis]|uniref:SMc04008-like domain-containing protein n=2 Tax=Marinobacter mobilis TaxID=488533 RepID=A0A1H3A999_9GAMM|nr:hypothetical protein SAMN04487960_107217 [Marinobacter mobilis]
MGQPCLCQPPPTCGTMPVTPGEPSRTGPGRATVGHLAEKKPMTDGEPMTTPIPEQIETEIQAAAFRRLVEHLQQHPEVQNIDLMNLAGFCRNCLSKWYLAEATERGVDLTDPQARERIYGMPYEDWKARHQKGPKQEHKGSPSQ